MSHRKSSRAITIDRRDLLIGAATVSALPFAIWGLRSGSALAQSNPRHEANRVNLSSFGARPGADASPALRAAVDYLGRNGGGSIDFAPGATYRFDQIVDVNAPNIALRGDRTVLTGRGRIVANNTAGDVRGGRMLIGFAMTGFHMTGSFRGPILKKCRNFELGYLSRDNTAGTWINLLHCSDGWLHDCDARNGEATKIGYLVLGGESIRGERCLISGGGWVYGFQIKGGRGHVFSDCSISDTSAMKHAFRIRGDAPWRSSRTKGTYPFPDGAYSRPDVRRASRDCAFVDCRVSNTPGVHFLATEFVDCSFTRCVSQGSSRGPMIGLFAYRQDGGSERNLLVEDFRSEGASAAGMLAQGASAREPLSDIRLVRPVVTGAAENGIECRECNAPVIQQPRLEAIGETGIELRNSPGWQVTDPRISAAGVGLLATTSGSLSGANGISGRIANVRLP